MAPRLRQMNEEYVQVLYKDKIRMSQNKYGRVICSILMASLPLQILNNRLARLASLNSGMRSKTHLESALKSPSA